MGRSNTTIGGLNVTIRDDCGWHYYYAHMNVIASDVALWRRVAAGHRLGTVGNTGNASGTSPHLHFSVYPNAYRSGIDPFPLLQRAEANGGGGGDGGTPSCRDDCIREARRCSGNRAQRCADFDSDSCLEWGTDQTCSGACFGAGRCCTHSCSSGDQRCQGSATQSCGDYDADPCREWGASRSCGSDAACFGDGQCCTNACARGARECVDGSTWRACGDTDVDPCREWTAPPPGERGRHS